LVFNSTNKVVFSQYQKSSGVNSIPKCPVCELFINLLNNIFGNSLAFLNFSCEGGGQILTRATV
jgi:hypothetical protein